MRYFLLMPLLAGALLLTACETDTRTQDQLGLPSDMDTVDPLLVDELHAEANTWLNEAEADIRLLEERLAGVSPDDQERLINEVNDLREELSEIRSRLQVRDVYLDNWDNERRDILSDVDNLVIRAEHVVLASSTEPSELVNDARERLDQIDQIVATQPLPEDEQREIEQHVAEVENTLAQIESVPTDEFEDLRDDFADQFASLREIVHDARLRVTEQTVQADDIQALN